MLGNLNFTRSTIRNTNHRPNRNKQFRKIRSLKQVDEQHIKLAHSLADVAGTITTASFRKPDLRIIDKEDTSPVTEIDRRVESTLRSMIKESCPAHNIYGEEFGMENGLEEDYLWVIDPIDGTLSYITGKPLFGTLIALLYKGVPVLGIIDQPVLEDRWTGVLNQPTLYNGSPVACRECPLLSSAYVYSTTPDMFLDDLNVPYERLKNSVKGHLYGADCYAYGLLSMGQVDVVFEADMQVFDYMAMVPIVQGAGGVITDWSGEAFEWDGVALKGEPNYKTQVLAVGDQSLHQQIIELLK
eukprot:g4071.t1